MKPKARWITSVRKAALIETLVLPKSRLNSVRRTITPRVLRPTVA